MYRTVHRNLFWETGYCSPTSTYNQVSFDANNVNRLKFQVETTSNSDFEDIMTYAEALEHIEKQEQHDTTLWRY